MLERKDDKSFKRHFVVSIFILFISFKRLIISFKRYNKSFKQDICRVDCHSNILVSISVLIIIGKEMSFTGFRSFSINCEELAWVK